jgi:hypothetical protein
MNTKFKAVVESYVRSFIVALGVAYSDGFRGTEEILIAGLIAVAGPAIRAINPKDPAFGVLSDVVTLELNKLAQADKKKTVKKATKKKP